MFYKFELGYNSTEATRNNCFEKDEGPVDHRTVTRWLKKFRSDWKNFDDQTRSGTGKIIISEVVLEVCE